VSVAEAKNRMPELIRAVESGEKVVSTRVGRPVAQLTPAPPQPRSLQWGAMRDRIKLLPGWHDPIDGDRFLAGRMGRGICSTPASGCSVWERPKTCHRRSFTPLGPANPPACHPVLGSGAEKHQSRLDVGDPRVWRPAALDKRAATALPLRPEHISGICRLETFPRTHSSGR
jgi:prevent-host-death family protein